MIQRSKLIIAFALILLSGPSLAKDYNIVILNGRVMDPETNFDAIRNVGVLDGRIANITKRTIKGKSVIDATGHVVAPGFIDTQHHGHGNAWGVRASLRDGVTSPMDLEYGNINTAEWYVEREGKWIVNYAAAASHEMQRMRVLDGLVFEGGYDAEGGLIARGQSYVDNGIPDWAETQPTLEQINDIMAGIDEELRQGALTSASTMGYMAVGASTLEVFNLQKAAASYQRSSSFHVRLLGNSKPPYEGTLGNLEQMANGAALVIRGRMQKGMVADITIFDPKTVTDNAGYKIGTNGLPSTGIPYVLVNGVVVVRDSEVVDGVYPGQPIRYPVEQQARWVPLEKQSYLEDLLQPDLPFDDGLEGQH